jgi:hypothetical protein
MKVRTLVPRFDNESEPFPADLISVAKKVHNPRINFPDDLSTVSKYAGYISGALKAAKIIGLLKSDKAAIIAEIKKVASLILKLKNEVFKFLEDQEERHVLASISGSSTSIESFTRSPDHVYRQSLLANIIDRMNNDMNAIKNNIERLHVAGDHRRAIRYAGMLGLVMANRRVLASEILSKDNDQQQANAILLSQGGVRDGLLAAVSKAKKSATKEVEANFRIAHKEIGRSGGRISGYRIKRTSGIEEWGTYVKITEVYEVYSPGEKTRSPGKGSRRRVPSYIGVQLQRALASRKSAAKQRLHGDLKKVEDAINEASV